MMDGRWYAVRKAIICAASRSVGVIVSGMTGHLTDGAAETPKGTAAILAAFAILFWDRILLADEPPGIHDRSHSIHNKRNPNGPIKETDKGNGQLDATHGIVPILIILIVLIQFERNKGKHFNNHVKKCAANHNEDNFFEGATGLCDRCGHSIPVQTHPGHHLTKGKQRAPNSEANLGVANTVDEAITASIFPLSNRNTGTRLSIRSLACSRNRHHETLALFNATLGHFDADGVVVVNLGVEFVAFGQCGRGHDLDHGRGSRLGDHRFHMFRSNLEFLIILSGRRGGLIGRHCRGSFRSIVSLQQKSTVTQRTGLLNRVGIVSE
mmetsp:Transcript_8060/g.18710  ORF Transcript_8060/g.18710 Transcript_8060/m.18710 type:complete len:324 (-) Transcript_8060:168-1139(-)